ncbi:Oxysterol-binding protein [Macrophomina phaseolina MS6]|uniref:Oxysterol-binding protein n=1 Tax=Macrophomina phaseolina (strain MS6) TaxID=1126212 RepID=K2SCF7_MACPH|nr:Oxysterol-binding protein [Macrophomina phaseolina MS6]
MEQLQIHSKSYLVRWINVPAGHSISWSIQPHKKSVNFGIFKHPGNKNGETPNLPSTVAAGINDAPQTAAGGDAAAAATGRPRGASVSNGIGANASRNDRTLVVEKLQSIGLKPVSWTGKCEADKVSMGRYDVPEGEGGMYGLVFDNTFSKQVSKTATFVLMTHPTSAPPKSGHHLHFSTAVGAGGSSPNLQQPSSGDFGESTDSLAHQEPLVAADPRPRSRHVAEATTPGGSLFYTGVLLKKRRKRNQGYARRFFSLDFTSSTLSYYQSRSSSALRGAIPLSLAAIAADEKTREISVDSGAEVWHLKANNKKDFDAWKDALERASSQAGSLQSPEDSNAKDYNWPAPPPASAEQNDRDWGRIEALVGRVSGIRDAVRRLAKDTDPKALSPAPSGASSIKGGISGVNSPAESTESGEYFKDDDASSQKKSSAFWKRKPSASAPRKSISGGSGNAAPTSAPSAPPLPNGGGAALTVPKVRANGSAITDESIHEHVLAILRDLDFVVSESSSLLQETRLRRQPTGSLADSRKSIDSMSDDEFFDATGGDEDPGQSKLLTIRRDSNDDTGDRNEEVSDGESEASSEAEGIGAFDRANLEGQPGLIPPKPKSLSPLPLEKVPRRTTVAAPKVAPPSLIAFLRKNVGKDLSTIAMPVSANEPLSLVQRIAEQMEYSELIDAAVNAPAEDGSRILYIMAFAISSFSNSRVKERAVRKPFNPMLGETFELVREDKGFRFLAEKVSHRPVRMACQAEAKEWTFLQSPMPVQKFWGKSAELNTDGRARVFLHNPGPSTAGGEHYSWTMATSFLRNIIAGEKYVEPVGTMTVINETTGAKAIATFKAGGMFAGRSEEVSVQAFAPPDQGGAQLSLGLAGKWTSELHFTRDGADTKQSVWMVGPLVDQPEKHYGFTTFAASLNEITKVEEGKIAKTDSRLRPDQRAVEEGDLDKAEALKARLEERQRQRRRVMEEHGEEWRPRWFVKVAGEGGGEGASGGEEEWRLKVGKDGYWEERARGEWSGVTDVLEV